MTTDEFKDDMIPIKREKVDREDLLGRLNRLMTVTTDSQELHFILDQTRSLLEELVVEDDPVSSLESILGAASEKVVKND